MGNLKCFVLAAFVLSLQQFFYWIWSLHGCCFR